MRRLEYRGDVKLSDWLILASFERKAAALLIDVLLQTAAVLVSQQAMTDLEAIDYNVTFGLRLWLAVVVPLACSLPTVVRGSSVGQAILGLRIVRFDGSALSVGRLTTRVLILKSPYLVVVGSLLYVNYSPIDGFIVLFAVFFFAIVPIYAAALVCFVEALSGVGLTFHDRHLQTVVVRLDRVSNNFAVGPPGIGKT